MLRPLVRPGTGGAAGTSRTARGSHAATGTRHLAAKAASLVLVAILAGCGGSPATGAPGSSPASTAAAPSSSVSSVHATASPTVEARASASAPQGVQPPALTPALAARLAATLRRVRSADHLPGIQVVVGYRGGWTWSAHAGMADLATGQPVTNDTLFDAGSITKTFVATLTLQLVDEGVLRLDDPVTRWVTGVPGVTGVTIRELLDHTSGIDDPFEHPPLLDALGAHPRTAWTPARVLRYVGPRHFAPGRGWYYSNANYLLLGEIVQAATGQSVASLLRQRFLVPLGLSHTFLQGEQPVSGQAAHGYDSAPTGRPVDLSDGSGYLPFTSLATALGTAGALVTTAGDLARWAQALYGGDVLPPATLSTMLDVGLTRGLHPRWPYGLGVQEITYRGQISWGHSGLLSGFHAAMRYFPATGLTIVVLMNDDTVNPDAVVATLLDALEAGAPGAARPPASPAAAPASPTALPAPPSARP